MSVVGSFVVTWLVMELVAWIDDDHRSASLMSVRARLTLTLKPVLCANYPNRQTAKSPNFKCKNPKQNSFLYSSLHVYTASRLTVINFTCNVFFECAYCKPYQFNELNFEHNNTCQPNLNLLTCPTGQSSPAESRQLPFFSQNL